MAVRVYLTLELYRDLTVLDEVRIDALYQRRPTFFARNFEMVSRQLEDRLRHKYNVPFPENHSTIQGWIVALVDPVAAIKVGLTPTDELFGMVRERAATAETQITDASNPQSANWNLPLKGSEDASAISKGGPFGYAEASPYDCIDVQWEAVHQ